MAFCSHVSGFAVQPPRQLQYHVFQQPIFHMPPPHFLTMHQVHPIGVMPAHHLPFAVMMPTPLSPSQPILPPGAPSLKSVPPRGLCLRVVFYGHASHEHNTPPLCVTNATYADSVPSRDGLLADVASWAGLHGLSIRHAGGRIDPSKAKLYILPRGSPGGGLLALEVVPGGGLAMPGDVIKVVRLEGVEERVWEETLRDVRREGYEGVVAVDMSASSSSSSDATGDSDTTATDEAPAPAASVVDADANADTGVAAST